MKSEIPYYACMIISQVWVATSRTAFTISPFHIIMGLVWMGLAFLYEINS